MVKIGCISLHVSGISLTLWLHMIMVVVERSFLATTLAQ